VSESSITRLTTQWQDEARAFAARDLSGVGYVYLWADGIHLKIRLEQEKLCLLVMIGVCAYGRRELVALTDGFRESHESWADLLRDCRRRGMRAPILAVGDGALGFWKSLREVFPQTKEQRCWFHKQANTRAALPKSAHPGAQAAMKEIYNAEDADKARAAITVFGTRARSSRRPWRRSSTTPTCCWSSTTTRPSIGSICARRTPSNLLSRQCV
jgi:putative transposase